jgi:uncharacterized protein with FMN-binding domain
MIPFVLERRLKVRRMNALLLIPVATCMSLLVGCKTIDVELVGGPLQTESFIDGIYEGTSKGGPVKVVAKVSIQGKRITNIELLEHRTLKGRAAEKIIPDRIIKEQSTKVDAVTSATVSSRVIMNAVEDAVRKAIK